MSMKHFFVACTDLQDICYTIATYTLLIELEVLRLLRKSFLLSAVLSYRLYVSSSMWWPMSFMYAHVFLICTILHIDEI